MPATQAMGGEMSQALNGYLSLLKLRGIDSEELLANTPGRAMKAFVEMTAGYDEKPAAILGKRFKCDTNDLVIVKGIDFVSLCAHHLLPFVGQATVAYLPQAEVVGLSKIPRLVECFARRLQLQEQMTHQIADALATSLQSRGAACIVEASHSCMACRGVKKKATMITSSMLGEFRTNPVLRGELLALVR